MTVTYPGPLIQARTQVPTRPNSGTRARATLTNTHYINAEHILSTPHGGRVDWSPTGFIAFSKYTSGKNGAEIWTMASDGTSQVDRTSASGAISHISNDQPTVHPSGNYIVFQNVDQTLYTELLLTVDAATALLYVQGGFGIDNNLWCLNLGNGTFRQLTTVSQGEGVLHPHFSPDGTKMVYAYRHRSGQVPSWEIVYADFLTDGAGPHLANAQLFAPLGQSKSSLYETHNMDPTGAYGLFSTDANPTPEQAPVATFLGNEVKLKFADGTYTMLTNDHNNWNESSQWSPSGNNIVWISSRGTGYSPVSGDYHNTLKTDLWRMSTDGSNQQQLTFFNTPGSAQYVAGTRVVLSDGSWSADGLHYVMQRDKIASGSVTSEVVVFDFSTSQ